MASNEIAGLLTTYELTVRACVKISFFKACYSEIDPSWYSHLEKLTKKRHMNDLERFKEERQLKSHKVSAEIQSDYAVAVRTHELRILTKPKLRVEPEVLNIDPIIQGETNLATFWKSVQFS